MEKKQIIQQALKQLNDYLHAAMGLTAGDYFSLEAVPLEMLSEAQAGTIVEGQNMSDAEGLRINNHDADLQYRLFVQPWAPQKDIETLISQVKSSAKKPILFADFINPVMAEKLRRRSIAFVDCAGNLSIRNNHFNYFVKRNKRTQLRKSRGRGRAFNTAGLKLIFAIFNQPEILHYSYRDISKRVDIALGSVGPVMDDLYNSGYIFDDGQRKLVNKKRLFERWVDGYLEKLRPKQIVACYRSEISDWWQQAEPADFGGVFGGEVSIAKSTPFMQPETISMYFSSLEKQRDFAKYYALKEDAEGDICIYRSFWVRQSLNVTTAENLSPMIMYADIVDAINPGNWEVAKTFYGEAIAHLLQE